MEFKSQADSDRFVAHLNRSIEDAISRAEGAVERHVAKLKENPLSAMEWSQDVFKEVALGEVAKVVKSWLEKHPLPIIENELRRMVADGARMPSFSTSVTSNMVSQFKLAAEAEFLAKFQQ